MARASGLVVAGGAEGNDPIAATTAGTGELIDRALDAGAKRIIVGLGGSATSDGGFGAVRSIAGIARLANVELLVACDVTTRFGDAAAVFGPQKGASPAQVRLLTNRLTRLAEMYAEEFGTDVTDIPGGGAAGGLGGALAAVGGRLVPGVELVADELDLFDHLDGADLVVTGEGRLDATSFDGKVVGGVLEIAAAEGIPVAAVVGDIADDTEIDGLRSVASLVERFGHDRAVNEPKACVEAATRSLLVSEL
jgi:glycerate kinase